MEKLKIIWSNQAKEALRKIYEYYKDKSLSGAKNVKSDLLKAPKTIYFSKQYQIDDINPKYRRIVVRDYKILYKEHNNTIQIVDIISTKQSPDILKNK
ncbi:type II toxin-antitoxin system RelE/ParE family toxin [Marinoscillum furvescens]|uniref:Plasmid stabilization system protein ParE n=1 Tax=Marinoscillum furvescens DSM 4134 TaxID=1122208 RepID=A0A3D9L5C6_MARFU|nr:type II toxin-antitoxin system RelE/ParE family toxin [Marinoscillum furvescens]REE01202.1 plasmid stabilization system protein ParE [Marinoscillum furvescens DSM 4134]